MTATTLSTAPSLSLIALIGAVVGRVNAGLAVLARSYPASTTDGSNAL